MRNLLKHIIIMFVIMLAGGAQCAFTMDPHAMTINCIDGVIQDVPVSILRLCGYFSGLMEGMAGTGDLSGTIEVGESRSVTNALIELLIRTVPREVQNASDLHLSLSDYEKKRIQRAIVEDLTQKMSHHSIESFRDTVSLAKMGDFLSCDMVRKGGQEALVRYVTTPANVNVFFLNPDYHAQVLYMLHQIDDGDFRGNGNPFSCEVRESLLRKCTDLHTFHETGRLEAPHDGLVGLLSIAYSPDGLQLASGQLNGTIRLWDLHRSEIAFRELQGHEELVSSLVYNPHGNQLASGSHDGTIKIWNPVTGACLAVLNCCSRVYSVAYNHDGTELVTVSDDRIIRIWNSCTTEHKTLKSKNLLPFPVSYDHKGAQLVVADTYSNNIEIWDAHNHELLKTLQSRNGNIVSVIFSPSDKQLVSTGNNNIFLWELDGADTPKTLKGHGGQVYSIAYHPDGSELASGSEDGTVKIWDPWADKGTPIRTLPEKMDAVRAVAYSPDGTHLAAGGLYEEIIKIFELQPHEFTRFLSLSQLAFYVQLHYRQHVTITSPSAYMMSKNGERHRITQLGWNSRLYTKGLSFFSVEHEQSPSIKNSPDYFLGNLYASMQSSIDGAHARGDLSAEKFKEFKDSLQHVEVRRGS